MVAAVAVVVDGRVAVATCAAGGTGVVVGHAMGRKSFALEVQVPAWSFGVDASHRTGRPRPWFSCPWFVFVVEAPEEDATVVKSS